MSATAKSTAKNGELIDDIKSSGNLAELEERESRIERAQRNAYLEIGLDLKAIRDSGLYKIKREVPVAGKRSFQTFEEYLEQRWGMDDSTARRLISAADAVNKMKSVTNVTVLPTAESHVRELLRIEDDAERAEVWKTITAKEDHPTAKIIEEYVEQYIALKEKTWVTLDEWSKFDDNQKSMSLKTTAKGKLNSQDNASIEWAQWSWNPITGCKHDCPYCYARDIAQRFYPQGFEPSIYPDRLNAPKHQAVPDKAKSDESFKNIFACSMADLFGKWVPAGWIEAVLKTARDCKQWNFLFLTKFPQRFEEFDDMPKNAWMGTTVDCQDRVANAEKHFAKLKGGTKWLSVEPMLTPLKFKQLDLFSWIVIGGASASTKTPEWVPPMDWIVDLHKQARDAGCSIYYKDNTGLPDELRLREFPWTKPAQRELPKALKYLNIA